MTLSKKILRLVLKKKIDDEKILQSIINSELDSFIGCKKSRDSNRRRGSRLSGGQGRELV